MEIEIEVEMDWARRRGNGMELRVTSPASEGGYDTIRYYNELEGCFPEAEAEATLSYIPNN